MTTLAIMFCACVGMSLMLPGMTALTGLSGKSAIGHTGTGAVSAFTNGFDSGFH